MVKIDESVYILLIVLAGMTGIATIYATLNTLYYFIRDRHWSWKWWLSVFLDSFGFIFKIFNFFSSSSSSSDSSSSGSSSRKSSGKSSGFGGGSSRGGGSGRSF